MGTDQSRLVQDTRRIRPMSSEKRARAAKDLVLGEWSEVHTCRLSEWSRSHAHVFGFDQKIDYGLPHVRSGSERFLPSIQPYCTRGYQFKVEKLQKHDVTIKHHANNKYKIPRLATKRSRYVCPLFAPTVSIIGYQRKVAVLQVVYKKTKELHFIAIELSTGKHLSVYRDIYINEPCIYEAYLSPDETCYLLRPNFYFAFSRCADPFSNFSITKDIKMISIQDFESCVLRTVEDIACLWHSIAFDPLYGHSRIALGNYTAEGMGDNMALYDIREMKVAALARQSYCNMSHHVTYNPQGTLLVSLGIRVISARVDLLYPIKVIFFHTQDLTLLFVISRDSVSLSHFHASLSPLFSKTGDYMALLGHFGHCVSVYRMPVNRALKHSCRLKILALVADELISQLPLPRKLQDYLLFLPQVL